MDALGFHRERCGAQRPTSVRRRARRRCGAPHALIASARAHDAKGSGSPTHCLIGANLSGRIPYMYHQRCPGVNRTRYVSPRAPGPGTAASWARRPARAVDAADVAQRGWPNARGVPAGSGSGSGTGAGGSCSEHEHASLCSTRESSRERGARTLIANRKDGGGRGAAHVARARAHDDDGEAERDAVLSGDGGVRAALDSGDGVLEHVDMLACRGRTAGAVADAAIRM